MILIETKKHNIYYEKIPLDNYTIVTKINNSPEIDEPCEVEFEEAVELSASVRVCKHEQNITYMNRQAERGLPLPLSLPVDQKCTPAGRQ